MSQIRRQAGRPSNQYTGKKMTPNGMNQ